MRAAPRRGSGPSAAGRALPLVDHRLPSGVRVIIDPTAGPRTGLAPVALQLWLLQGTASERPDEHGCAHLLEHMLFKPGADGRELAPDLEALGGDVNAYTSHDEVVIHATVPARAVVAAVERIHAAVLRPALDPAELGRERDVVLEEVRDAADDPTGRAHEQLMAALYAGHPYGRTVLGTLAEVRGHDVTRLRRVHRRTLDPRAVAWVVHGPVDPRAVLTAIARAWAEVAPGRGRAPGRIAVPRPPSEPPLLVREIDAHEALCMAAFLGPAAGARDAVALELASVILGEGEAPRLTTELRRREQLVNDAWTSFTAMRGGTCFTAQLAASAEVLHEAAAALLDQLRRLGAQAPDPVELARAKALVQREAVYRRETVEGRASALGVGLSIDGTLDYEERLHAHVDATSAEDVRRACAKWLVPGRAAIAALLPKQDRRAPSVARTRSALARARLAPAAAGRPVAATRVQGRHAIDLPGGPKLRIEVDRALPIVAGCIAWIGGQRAERPSEAGLHVLLARLLTRGDRARSGDELARELDGMAAAMAGFAGRGSVGLSFECLAADVGAVLDRALDAVIAPRFMDDEVDEERRVLIEEIEGERDDPAREVAGLARAHVYGPAHPYARRRRGTPATLERIDGALLERRWGQLYDLRDAVITVCGDVDVDAVQRRLAARLAGLPGAPRRAARSPSVRRPRALRAPIELQVKRDRAQCHVALGMPGLAVGDPRSAAMDVLLGLLVGQGGRLFMALREREGLVYHVSATASEGLDGGDVAVYAACSPAKLPRVRAVIDAELARLAAEPVPVDELERAKAGVCGQLEADRQRRARRASQMAMDELFGLGFLDEVEHVGRVMAVDAAGLHALARELFASRRRVTVIARPKASKAAARAAARKRQRSA